MISYLNPLKLNIFLKCSKSFLSAKIRRTRLNYKNSRIVVGLSCVTRLLNLATMTEGSGSLQVTMVIFCKIAFDHNDYRVAAGGLDSLILYRFNAIELLIRYRFFARFYCFHWGLQISKVIYLSLLTIIPLNFSLKFV